MFMLMLTGMFTLMIIMQSIMMMCVIFSKAERSEEEQTKIDKNSETMTMWIIIIFTPIIIFYIL